MLYRALVQGIRGIKTILNLQ